MAVAKGAILPQYNRQTVRAEEWLLDQQNFQGVDEAVVAALAQACRSEDISEGQEIQSRGQKLQDLLILREGKALQVNQPDAQGMHHLCTAFLRSHTIEAAMPPATMAKGAQFLQGLVRSLGCKTFYCSVSLRAA